MIRRDFHKLAAALFAGPALLRPAASAEQTAQRVWDLMILDAAPEEQTEIRGTAAADIDGDGHIEVIVAGDGSLDWYRPATFEKGMIARGTFYVGVALADVDGDGKREVITGKRVAADEKYGIFWYKPAHDPKQPWTEGVIDPLTAGGPHDVLAGDLNGDGRWQLVANAMYSDAPGHFIYQPSADPKTPWKKWTVQSGLSAEGTTLVDLNGDGKLEIVSGPYWFAPPPKGPLSGEPWKVNALAPGFREMCRTVACDITGNNRPDVIVLESEYPDGRLSWFENQLPRGLVEHPIGAPFNFAHTLQVWPGKETKFLLGEMNEGGWDAPYNWNARLLNFSTADRGQSWTTTLLYRGEGTHQAVLADVDGDGELEIAGHSAVIKDHKSYTGWVQLFKERAAPAPFSNYEHHFLDREKPGTGTDLVVADVDGDGQPDILCASWWYQNPTWQRREIPGIYQVLSAHDVDGDGRAEILATKKKGSDPWWYKQLGTDLFWLKAVDPRNGKWEEHAIGAGDGDWPHSTAFGPLLPGKKNALVCGYHDHDVHPPQIFEVPNDPRQPWTKRILANIPYGEEIVTCDLDGDGKLDLVAGPYWIENLGNGRFEPHLLAQGFAGAARCAVGDINGDGRPDIVLSVEDLDFKINKAFFAPIAWLENTGNPRKKEFVVHVIDRIRSPHSLSVADLDGDGDLEIIAAEHDPFNYYRSQCRLYVYKKVDRAGRRWARYSIDDRFEQHDGAKTIPLGNGKIGIVGHGWTESRYLHLWTPKP